MMGDTLAIRHVASGKPLEMETAGRMVFLPTTASPPPLWRGEEKPPVKASAVFSQTPYRLRMVLPQEMIGKEGNPSQGMFGKKAFKISRHPGISRLEAELGGNAVPLQIQYQQHATQSGVEGKGHIRSPHVDLCQGHLLIRQLSETFALTSTIPVMSRASLQKSLTDSRVSGEVSLDSRFSLRFPKPEKHPAKKDAGFPPPDLDMWGDLRFHNVSIAMAHPDPALPIPPIRRLNGSVRMRGDRLETRDLTLTVGRIPAQVEGAVWVNRRTLGIRVRVERAKLADIQRMLADGKVAGWAHRTLDGTADLTARLEGRWDQPAVSCNFPRAQR